GLVGELAYCILEDSTGKIWVGTDGDGVSVFDGKSFSNYTEEQGLPTNGVYSLIEGKDGSIWMGTFLGLVKYDGESYTHFDEQSGLGSNKVLSIIEDSDGIIWVGRLSDGTESVGGLTRFDGKEFQNFSIDQG